jgi:hypothetical protein
MALMQEESEEAHKWMSNISVECLARYAMDTNCKTDFVVNNLSEVFNRMILYIRGKPVRTMFEDIRNKIMTKHETKRTCATTARWAITPTYTAKLEESKK